ncbi:MAG: polysaccharide deacetylase, partial [Firmicutes bacterium]|nr:polysaccharide deacetylase [Bacillota bacterium]
WSVDTLDWESRNGKKVFNLVKKSGNLDGDVILLHSIHDSTADATEMLIPWLKEKGYQLVTVSELIKYKTGKDPVPGKVYWSLY